MESDANDGEETGSDVGAFRSEEPHQRDVGVGSRGIKLLGKRQDREVGGK